MADERNDERIAPVSLPAGQFELGELQKGLEKAVSVQDREKHPERITQAIVDTIKNPELLIQNDLPAVPAGASLVMGKEVNGVERDYVAFDGVEAESGEDASKMRYEERADEVVATAEAPGAPVVTDDTTTTLAGQAAERIAEETDASSSKAGGKATTTK